MRQLAIFLGLAALAWSEVPDCGLAPGWQQSGPRRSFEGESLYEYMNGNSEGYLAYGFQKMTGVTCKKDGITVIVDVSDMGDPESAYGIFTANRDVRSPLQPIAMGGQVVARKAIAAKGRYYLEVAAENDGDHRPVLLELAKALAAQVTGTTSPPSALGWFPTAGIEPGFPRLVPQSVLGIRILKRGYIAQYAGGAKAFIIPDATPDTYEKLKARVAESGSLNVGDCGFLGKDKYLGTIAAFRKGSFLAGYASIPEGTDATAMLNELAAKLR